MFYKDTNGNIIKYDMHIDSKPDPIALKILKRGEIKGLFIIGYDKNGTIRIPIANAISLDEYIAMKIEQGTLDLRDIFYIVRSTLKIIEGSKHYMLGDSSIIKSYKYVYMEREKNPVDSSSSSYNVTLICIPNIEAAAYSDSDKDFYRSIVSAFLGPGISEDQEKALIDMLKLINSPDFSLEMLSEYMKAEEKRIDNEKNNTRKDDIRKIEDNTKREEKEKNKKKRVKSKKVKGKKKTFMDCLEDFLFPSMETTNDDLQNGKMPTAVASVIVLRRTGDVYPLCFTSDYIGTDENICSICLEKLKGVDDKHCRIFVDRDSFYLEDLNSSTGTFLNNEKLSAETPALLSPADLIRVGEEEMVFTRREDFIKAK